MCSGAFLLWLFICCSTSAFHLACLKTLSPLWNSHSILSRLFSCLYQSFLYMFLIYSVFLESFSHWSVSKSSLYAFTTFRTMPFIMLVLKYLSNKCTLFLKYSIIIGLLLMFVVGLFFKLKNSFIEV